jgi:hypothetical protein
LWCGDFAVVSFGVVTWVAAPFFGCGSGFGEGEGAGGFSGEEDLGAAFGLLVEAVEEDGGGFGFGFEAEG